VRYSINVNQITASLEIYKLMIAYKNSFADIELIEVYIHYYNNLRETSESIKKFEKGAKKKIIKKMV
jgi:hypothetical protein